VRAYTLINIMLKAGQQNRDVTISHQAWLTLAILSSTLLVVFFSETMLLPAIPEIMKDFSISYGTAAWIFSAYLIVAAVMTPIAGKMSDIYGKKKILLVLLAMYAVGIAAGGFANNISFLLASRIIQGLGLAAVPAAFSLLRDTFPPAKLAIAVGVFGSAYSAGSVVGLLAGATIIQNLGWHTTFFSIVPFAALVIIMITKFVKENNLILTGSVKKQERSEKRRIFSSIDMKGAFVLSITIIGFLIALTLIQTGVNSKNLPQIEVAFIVSLISLVMFVIVERRVTSPLVDLRMLKDKTLMPSYIILVATGITMFMVYPAIVQLVRSPIPLGFGGDAVDAANVQLPFMIMFLVFASLTPIIISRIGRLNPIIMGTVISIIASIGLLMFHSTEIAVSTSLAILASGLSMTITATWNIVVSSAPKLFVGISVGVGALLLFLGMAIGPALTGVYLESNETIDGVSVTYPSQESYNLVYITSGLLSAASLASVLMLKNSAHKMEIEVR
jgi:MFS family permease